jgi:hypothetical protein
MAFVLKDRVRETCNSPGTGAATLLGAVTGYVGFSVIGAGNSTYYTIADQSGSNWEVGIGSYSSGPDTLVRATVLSNSAGTTSFINFSSGTQDVFVTYPSDRAVFLDTGDTTSYTDGQLLIGDSSTGLLNKATLTAGTNVTITNGNGSITIAASGGGGGGASSLITTMVYGI